jgi:stage III sporulation protein AF
VVAWLSDWLRDIIAVILLAVIVELLLPNKAMQRYARLVVGLFILLTILSPILKLIQSDIGTKLDESMDEWSKAAATKEVQMPGLDQIRRDAERLSEKRELEAAMLMERTLEDSIKSEITERTKAPVDSVDAELKWAAVSGRQTPYISQVTVTLKSADMQAGLVREGTQVEDVSPVAVDVDVEVEIERSDEGEAPANPAESGSDTENARKQQHNGEKWTGAEPAAAAAISTLIVQGWGVDADRITVRQPVVQSNSQQ